MVEILKCKSCGNIMVVDIKQLWYTKSCSVCESENIENYNFDVEEEIE